MSNNKEKIIKLLQEKGQLSVKQFSEALDISLSMTHRHLKVLVEDKYLKKIGSAPRVFYSLADKPATMKVEIMRAVPSEIEAVLNEKFILISPSGERTDGITGFIRWCEKRGFDVIKKAEEYMEVYKKYNIRDEDNLISGKSKIIKAFGDDTCLDDIFYGGFYAWEVFGKTKLGQLLLYAKQSQDRKLIKEVIKEIEPIIRNIIRIKNIDAVGFIPPTVKRQTQFMKVFQESLSIALPTIDIVKIKTEIITPQKTLSKLPDRIENANNTMVVTEKMSYKNVLLIDDAIGSGATLNQVACKVKKNNVAQKIYGFAITGSIKGFDVISEV
jgi:DNA-binding Lrp family transcriptional regulator